MSTAEALHPSDAAVVSRFFQVRGIFHDGVLARLEKLVPQRYQVQTTHRLASTFSAQVRVGFVRPGADEIWPVIFMTAIDISVALAVQITSEQLASMGTLLNGPQRLRHRHWDDWLGWEKYLHEIAPRFFEQTAEQQQGLLTAWCLEGFEWLAKSGLLHRLARP
jgi:hypothetical protein